MKEKSTWEEFFDAHAPVYEDNIFTKNTLREVDFLIEELSLPPAGSILDVGCAGRDATPSSSHGADIPSPGWTSPARCSPGPRRRLRRPGSPSSGSAPKPPGSPSPKGTTAPSAYARGPSGSSARKTTPSASRVHTRQHLSIPEAGGEGPPHRHGYPNC